MRFTAAAVALFAGLAAALPQDVETVTSTDEVTVISCAPTVTNCPGNSGAGATYPATTPAWTSVPAVTPVPVVTPYPSAPAPEVTTIWSTVSYCTYSVTPVVSTVVPSAPPAPSGGAGGVPHKPSPKPSGVAPSASASPAPTYNAAGAVTGSISFAGLAAAAAFFMA
ncbi:hypothetical protein N7510_001980 [Penicillium lagena]|uniref:uncharacterized protein n=1 Tax=Penicillium lagena TaxID=94218 RepID=UPI00254013C9|nr:uncharacterized protein N7510_001980 [Penicillium lagena]KAJ5625671.1 hypothetical protein N7510_001980 [Penicillium lagena]